MNFLVTSYENKKSYLWGTLYATCQFRLGGFVTKQEDVRCLILFYLSRSNLAKYTSCQKHYKHGLHQNMVFNWKHIIKLISCESYAKVI